MCGTYNLAIPWAVTLAMAAPSLGQSDDTVHSVRTNQRSGTATGEREEPLSQDDSLESTAEAVLRALQKQQPPSDILYPRGSEPVEPRSASLKLLPEGASLVDQVGYVQSTASGWAFVPKDEKENRPIALLPNAVLEMMVRTDAGSPHPVPFIISGEVTNYRGENHLIPRVALRANPPTPREEPHTPSHSGLEGAQGPGQLGLPSAQHVLERLRAERPRQEIVGVHEANASAGRSTDSVRGNSARPRNRNGLRSMTEASPGSDIDLQTSLRPDGTIFAGRTGRVELRGGRWFFIPESDHPEHPEPPMELLPCANTDFMAEMQARQPHGLVFVVTGEITLFDRRNFLLPRVAIRQMASDNLQR